MKRIFLVAAAALALAAVPAVASATTTPPTPTSVQPTQCPALTNWYVNGDETDRLPQQVVGGLKFTGADLIHHTATDGLTVEHLTHGTYTASPAPDQPSFFSVEVYGKDGGYATLRWNTTTSKWDMVTGGQIYSDTDPAALVDMVTPHKSHHVISFGVGYTQNPPGTVTTVVSSVTFGGHTYTDFGCKVQQPSSAPTTSMPVTHSPTPTATSSHPGTSDDPSPTASRSSTPGALAITGSDTASFAAVGLGVMVGGACLVAFGRNRRRKFRA